MPKIILLIALVLPGWVIGQLKLDDIDDSAIPYKKVKDYLAAQKDMAIVLFSDMTAACSAEADLAGFRSCIGKYKVKAAASDVWNAYVNADPLTSWKTKKSATGLVYSRHNDSLIYPGQHIDRTDIGQVLFLNLKLAKGLFKMATAIEITEVCDEEGTITFSYLSTGKTHGMQEVKFLALEDGSTLIEHTSWVNSGSDFRDAVLYPFFHKKLIRAFHRKMRESIN